MLISITCKYIKNVTGGIGGKGVIVPVELRVLELNPGPPKAKFPCQPFEPRATHLPDPQNTLRLFFPVVGITQQE